MTSMTTTQLPEDAGGRPGDTAEVAAVRDRLAATIRGEVIDAGHDDYDAVRAVYNRMIDRRPAVDRPLRRRRRRDRNPFRRARAPGCPSRCAAAGTARRGTPSSTTASSSTSRRCATSSSTRSPDGRSSAVAPRGAMSTTPRRRSASRCPVASCRPRVWRGSRSAAGAAISPGPTVCPATRSSRRRSSPPTGVSCGRPRTRTPSSSGRCAAGAATSAW